MTTITASQLKAMHDRNRDLVLINTLPANQFAHTMIPGAINIPQDQEDFVDRVEDAAGGRERPVVVYCATAACKSSLQAAEKLEQAGWANVFDFEGGYEAWQQYQENAPSHVAASSE